MSFDGLFAGFDDDALAPEFDAYAAELDAGSPATPTGNAASKGVSTTSERDKQNSHKQNVTTVAPFALPGRCDILLFRSLFHFFYWHDE